MTPTDIAISASALSNQNFTLPAALWTGAAVLKRIHGIWQGSLYIQNLPGFLSGAGYKFLSGDNPFMTWPTVPFFITARFLNLFEQEDEWNRSRLKWLDALKCVQPVHYKPEIQQGRVPYEAKYTISWIKIRSYCLTVRIQRIGMKTLDLLWHNFKLIMRVMDVVELVTMDLSTLPSRSALESGMHVPRCLAFLENPENKEVFFARLNDKKIGLITVGEFYVTDKLKAEDCVKQLFNFMERGLFYYKKTTGIWGDAVTFLIKQGIYDWSPSYVQQILEEPNSKEFLKKIHAGARRIISPPLEAISYVPDKILFAPAKPVKKNHFVKVIATPSKPVGNMYGLNSKKQEAVPLPQFTYFINNH